MPRLIVEPEPEPIDIHETAAEQEIAAELEMVEDMKKRRNKRQR